MRWEPLIFWAKFGYMILFIPGERTPQFLKGSQHTSDSLSRNDLPVTDVLRFLHSQWCFPRQARSFTKTRKVSNSTDGNCNSCRFLSVMAPIGHATPPQQKAMKVDESWFNILNHSVSKSKNSGWFAKTLEVFNAVFKRPLIYIMMVILTESS